jgi:hypothetical protein
MLFASCQPACSPTGELLQVAPERTWRQECTHAQYCTAWSMRCGRRAHTIHGGACRAKSDWFQGAVLCLVHVP